MWQGNTLDAALDELTAPFDVKFQQESSAIASEKLPRRSCISSGRGRPAARDTEGDVIMSDGCTAGVAERDARKVRFALADDSENDSDMSG